MERAIFSSAVKNTVLVYAANSVSRESKRSPLDMQDLFYDSIKECSCGATEVAEKSYFFIIKEKIPDITYMNIFLFTGFVISAAIATKLYWKCETLEKENKTQQEKIEEIVKQKNSLEERVDQVAERLSILEKEAKEKNEENKKLREQVDFAEFDGESRGYQEAHNKFYDQNIALLQENKILRVEKMHQDDKINDLTKKLEKLAMEVMEIKKNGPAK